MRFGLLRSCLLPVLVAASPTLAQCTPTWSTALGGGDINGSVFAIAVFDDDGPGPNPPCLFAAGQFVIAGGIVVNNIAKWDGSHWVGLGGGTDDTIFGLCVYDPDGSGPNSPVLCVVGGFNRAGGITAPCIAFWDGSSWSTTVTGFGVNDFLNTAAVFDEDGGGPLPESLIVGGSFAGAGSVSTPNIARWNGSSWAAMSTGFPTGMVRAVAVYDDDGAGPHLPSLYCGGNFTAPSHIARWDGSSWQPVGAGANGNVLALATYDPDGPGPLANQLYIGGTFSSAGGGVASNIASWNGTFWSPLWTGITGSNVMSMASVDFDGSGPGLPKLYVGGQFYFAGTVNVQNFAAWDGTSWSSLGDLSSNVKSVISCPQPSGGASLVIGGQIRTVNGVAVDNIAQYAPGGWSRIGPAGGGANGSIYALKALDPDGPGPAGKELYAGGNFSEINGVPAKGLAKLSGGVWSRVGPDLEVAVLGLRFFDEDGAGPLPPVLVTVGSFGSIGETNTYFVARYDGSTWSSVGGGVHNGATTSIEVFDEDDDGPLPPALFVTGWFTTAGGVPCANIARWNGTAWSPLGSGIPGTSSTTQLLDMTVWDPDGPGPAHPMLIVAGRFTAAGGVPVQNIAAWTGSGWQALGSGLVADVRTVRSFDPDGDGPLPPLLIAGGTFFGYLKAFDGAAWNSIGNPNGTVASLEVQSDGGAPPSLYVGGYFSSVAGTAASHIAKWNGQTWSALGPGTGEVASALASFDPDGTGPATASLYAGGPFTTVGTFSSAYIARWGCPDPTPCYANCDGSTSTPLLTANDFQCFLNAFAASLPSANCDGSTTPPVLNANDFQCFLNTFAAGCP